jgi:hypothetical protein
MSTPSLLNIPYLYKAGTLYSQIPESGAGDFTVSRTTTVANRSTRINKDGLIETVLDNVPRLDYPLGGAVNGCPALLVEPSAQNLLQRSEEFENAYWSKPLGVVTQNQTIAPDGLTTADKYVVNNGQAANSPITRTFTFAINTTYTLSLFVKKADYDTASIRLSTTETGATPTSFDLALGTATNNQIQNYGNGWYRVWVTFTTAATVTNGQVQLIRDAQVRDGVAGIFIWGAQLELGSVPTSYIRATTAAATRSAETITNTTASALIGQSEGTIYWDIAAVGGVLTGTGNPQFGVRNSAFTNWIGLTSNGVSNPFRITAQATTGALINYQANITSGKAALAWSSAGLVLYVNGISVATSATNPNFSFSRVDIIGLMTFKANAFELHPNRLTNAQLATLTSP